MIWHALATASVSAVIAFCELPAGDVIVVEFESTGCFAHEKLDLTFRGGEPRTVSLREASSPNATEVSLTDAELRRLDADLALYRSTPSRECTTTDAVTLSHLRGGRRIATEHFVDASCESSGAIACIARLARGPVRGGAECRLAP